MGSTKRIIDYVPVLWDIEEKLNPRLVETFVYDEDTDEYELSNRGILAVQQLLGVKDSVAKVFTENIDFFLRDNKIQWVDSILYSGGVTPDDGTVFTVTVWKSDKKTFNYMDSFGDEIDVVWDTMDYIQKTSWIDTSTGNDLDRVAAIFDLLREAGETDPVFRARIKATIPTFTGGGTKSAIQDVIYGYTGVRPTIVDGIYPAEFYVTLPDTDIAGVDIEDMLAQIDVAKAAGVVYTFDVAVPASDEVDVVDLGVEIESNKSILESPLIVEDTSIVGSKDLEDSQSVLDTDFVIDTDLEVADTNAPEDELHYHAYLAVRRNTDMQGALKWSIGRDWSDDWTWAPYSDVDEMVVVSDTVTITGSYDIIDSPSILDSDFSITGAIAITPETLTAGEDFDIAGSKELTEVPLVVETLNIAGSKDLGTETSTVTGVMTSVAALAPTLETTSHGEDTSFVGAQSTTETQSPDDSDIGFAFIGPGITDGLVWSEGVYAYWTESHTWF